MTARIRWLFRGKVAAESVARGICASALWLKSKPPTTTPIVYLAAAMRLGNTQGGTVLTHSGLGAKPVPSPERAIYILEPAGNSRQLIGCPEKRLESPWYTATLFQFPGAKTVDGAAPWSLIQRQRILERQAVGVWSKCWNGPLHPKH